jgi:hypothetical protein
MIVETDGLPRVGWALQDVKTKRIHLATVCEDEDQAHALLRGRTEYQPHRGACRVVAIAVTVMLSPKAIR